MKPRFVGRLSLADVVTTANASLGFLAVVSATVDARFAARLVLLAAVADGLDGVIARRFGGSSAGEYLDSLADVASFGVAPAALVVAIASEQWGFTGSEFTTMNLLTLAVPALFVAMAVVRLGMYTAFDTDDAITVGVPTTLAATIIAATILTGVLGATGLLAATALFCYLMVSTIEYPDLLARDALIMGVVHTLAVFFPDFQGRTFPYAIFFLALAYLTLGPLFYWRDV